MSVAPQQSTNSILHFSDAHLPGAGEEGRAHLKAALHAALEKQPGRPITFSGDMGYRGYGAMPWETVSEMLDPDPNATISAADGNHDHFLPDLIKSRSFIRNSSRFDDLNEGGVRVIFEGVGLVGADGSPDFLSEDLSLRCFNPTFRKSSFPGIFASEGAELTHLDGARRMQELARKSTERIMCLIDHGFYDLGLTDIVVVTHYPPFVEAVLFGGIPAKREQCHTAVNFELGKQLLARQEEFARRGLDVWVQCGHTHETNHYDCGSIHIRIAGVKEVTRESGKVKVPELQELKIPRKR